MNQKRSQSQAEPVAAKSASNVANEARVFFTSALIALVPTLAALWAVTALLG